MSLLDGFKNGCGCGIIEADHDCELRAMDYMREVKNLRKQIERMERQAERLEEKARRLAGGGKPCETCEEAGGCDGPPNYDGLATWDVCDDCDGFGITRAATCADHSCAHCGQEQCDCHITYEQS